MNISKTIAFFGAHPDDETFGPGATLASYSLKGAKVYYVCATRGEAGTVDSRYLKEHDTIAELRTAEMACAARALGLTGVLYLGFRDSGMPGSSDNTSPEALMNAPETEVERRVVKAMREIKPDVVITHDPSGGYGHPDHVAVHRAVVKAFVLAGNPEQYPDEGMPFSPRKLYFTVRRKRLLRLMVKLMPLFGQDPKRSGRNGDVDLTCIARTEYPINAEIRISKQAAAMRKVAIDCHHSQGGGRPHTTLLDSIIGLLGRLAGNRDYYMRVYPLPGKKEKDLLYGTG